MSEPQPDRQIEMEKVIPVGLRVLILRDDAKSQTKGGVFLPGNVHIPTLRGTILELGGQVASDSDFDQLTKYCRVIYNPARAVPVEFEDCKHVVIPVEDVVAIIERPSGKRAAKAEGVARGR